MSFLFHIGSVSPFFFPAGCCFRGPVEVDNPKRTIQSDSEYIISWLKCVSWVCQAIPHKLERIQSLCHFFAKLCNSLQTHQPKGLWFKLQLKFLKSQVCRRVRKGIRKWGFQPLVHLHLSKRRWWNLVDGHSFSIGWLKGLTFNRICPDVVKVSWGVTSKDHFQGRKKW